MGIEYTARGLHLVGAYGRETNMADWRAGKDFKIIGGPYCSNRDLEAMKAEGFDLLEFRKHDGTFVELIPLNPILARQTQPGRRVLNEG